MHTKMVSGGIEAMVCGLTNELAKNNDVTLCTIFEPSSNDIFLNRLSSDIKIETIGKKKCGFSIKEIFKIYGYLKTRNFEIVHIHGCFQYYILAILLLAKRIKFVYTIHSDASMENQKWDRRLLFIKKKCFRDKVVFPVTISKTSQQSFVDVYNCSNMLIFNGIIAPAKCDINKLKLYKLNEKTKLFIHPARISEAKNQLVLCAVFDRLIKEGYDIVLVIAGIIENEQIYQKMTQYFNNRIIYIGERDDVTDLMQFCDGFCLPSIWEGLPISLLEALATGCIPICSPVGGINDVVIDGFNGILSESSSETDYYESVKRFLAYRDCELSAIKRRAMENFSEFSISNTANRYLELYTNLVKEK